MFRLHQLRYNFLCEAAVMGIHEIEWHLNRVEFESVLVGDFQHVQMHARIFMAGEADIPNLAGIACLHKCGVGSFIIKDAMRIFVPQNFMMLDEIDALDLQTLKRFIQLPGRFLLRTAIDFRHDKCLFAVAIAKRFAHADLARPFVVIPAVVQEVNAADRWLSGQYESPTAHRRA